MIGLPELVQRLFPMTLQLGGDQTVVGINLEELPFRECSLILQALQLLGLRLCHGALSTGARDYRCAIRIQFHWRQRGEESFKDLRIDRGGS